MKTIARFAALALASSALFAAPYAALAAAQDAAARPAQTAPSSTNSPASTSAIDIGMLETQLRHYASAPDSPEFGRTSGQYWGVISASMDFPRAYDFFASLDAASESPNATLLASKASAAGGYIGWLYEHKAQDQLGEAAIRKLMAASIAEYQQALTLDPENFTALYGYAVFEGYRPEGKEHQKELLAKLDSLRTSKPYYPWTMVDQLEKTGRPN